MHLFAGANGMYIFRGGGWGLEAFVPTSVDRVSGTGWEGSLGGRPLQTGKHDVGALNRREEETVTL